MDDPAALDKLDQETMGKQGERTDLVYNINKVKEAEGRPTGTSRQYALRKLRNDRPDLHEQVVNKEMSAHAAMKEAGMASLLL